MGAIVEFTIVPEQPALGGVLAATPEVDVELDRIAPTPGAGVPYLWATGGGFEAFERELRESPLVDGLAAIDRTGEGVLYRLDWSDGAETLLKEIARSNVTVLEAYRDGDWSFRLRFDRHEDLSVFHEYCAEHDVSYRLDRVYPDSGSASGDHEFGLTAAQRDALVLAVERGYFRVPRGVTLAELGDELGISQQAVSERVRRAADRVFRTTFRIHGGD